MRIVSRRRVVGGLGIALLAPIVAACGQSAPPTAVPGPTGSGSPAPAGAKAPAEAPKAAEPTKPAAEPTKPAAAPAKEAEKPSTPAAAAAPGKPGAVKMRWTGLSATYAIGFPEAFNEAGKRFGAEFDLEVVPGDYVTRVLTQFAAGQPPDVFRVENQVFTTFVGKGALQDLTPYTKDPSFNTEEYFPQLLKSYFWKGKYYGLPEDLQPASPMFYNRKLFDDAKEPYPTNELDWPATLEMAKRMTKSSGGRTQVFGYHVVNRFWHTHVYAFGTHYVDSIDDPTRFTFTDPKVVEAFQYKVDLIHKHKVSPTPEAMTEGGMSEGQLFSTGRIAAYTAGTWESADFLQAGKSLNWGMVISPKGFDGKRKYPTGGSGWAIPAGHKNADLAWKINSFVNGPEGQKIIIDTKPKPTVWFFSVKKVADAQAKELAPLIENVDQIVKSADWVEWYPRHVKWLEIRDKIITPGVDLILRNQVPIADGLKKINDDANAALKAP
jgi:multiple sugar transport system substrate-binding protein